MLVAALSAALASPQSVALQSAHGGDCILASPLRFGDCGAADAYHFAVADRVENSDGSQGAAIPDDDDNAVVRLSSTVAHQKAATTIHLKPSRSGAMACADARCLRCLARGNSNRVRIALCAFDGYEAVRMQRPPGALTAAASAVVNSSLSAAFALLALALGASYAWLKSRERAETRMTLASWQMRRLRLALRSARDECRDLHATRPQLPLQRSLLSL